MIFLQSFWFHNWRGWSRLLFLNHGFIIMIVIFFAVPNISLCPHIVSHIINIGETILRYYLSDIRILLLQLPDNLSCFRLIGVDFLRCSYDDLLFGSKVFPFQWNPFLLKYISMDDQVLLPKWFVISFLVFPSASMVRIVLIFESLYNSVSIAVIFFSSP